MRIFRALRNTSILHPLPTACGSDGGSRGRNGLGPDGVSWMHALSAMAAMKAPKTPLRVRPTDCTNRFMCGSPGEVVLLGTLRKTFAPAFPRDAPRSFPPRVKRPEYQKTRRV